MPVFMGWRITFVARMLTVLAATGLVHLAFAAKVAGDWRKHTVVSGFHASTAVAADFTGDGKVDVITCTDGKVLLFTAPDWQRTVISDPAAPVHCIHSEVLDVNRDGRPDWIGAQYDKPGKIVWLENPGKAGAWRMRVVDDQVNGIHGLLVGDVDGDGHPDLAANSGQPTGTPFPNSLVWYRAPKKADAPWQRTVFAQGDAPGLSHYLGLGDVNGDGRTDGATGAKGGAQDESGSGEWFAWWEAPKDPKGIWKKHPLPGKHPGATNIHMADVNGDKRMDFIASRGHGKGLLWFEAPDWKMHDINPDLVGAHCLAVGDVDGDGDTDAVTCAKDDLLAAWFENDGKGRFTTHILGRNQAAYDIRLLDMDGDKDLDVLIAGQVSKNVVWYENPLK